MRNILANNPALKIISPEIICFDVAIIALNYDQSADC